MIPRKLLQTFSRTTIYHEERLDESETRIYIPNHTSLLDAIILAGNLPEHVVFVANHHIMKKYAWAMSGREVLAINPLSPYAIRQMIKVLRLGKSLVVFPEGKISVTNNLMKIYPGVVYLSVKTGVPLVPIAINGAEKAKKFTYIEGKIPTRYFPKTTLYIGESFTLPIEKEISMKEAKEKGKHLIYRKMQETLLSSRMIDDVNLITILKDRVREAPEMVITDEVHAEGMDKWTMKDLWNTVCNLEVILAEHFSTGEKEVGLLLPTSYLSLVGIFSLLKNGKTPALLSEAWDNAFLESVLYKNGITTVLTSRSFLSKIKRQDILQELKLQVKFIFIDDLLTSPTIIQKWKARKELKEKKSYPQSTFLLISENEPKGKRYNHHDLYRAIHQMKLMIDMTAQDKIVHALPMYEPIGLFIGLYSPLNLIPTVLIPSTLSYQDIPEITYDRNATILFGTEELLSVAGDSAEPYDFARLRYVFHIGAKVEGELRITWFEKFGIRLLETYQIDSKIGFLSMQTPILYKKGTVGCIVPGIIEEQRKELEVLQIDEGDFVQFSS